MGIPVFDPTDLLLHMPQSELLAEEGQSLTHYAEDALPVVADALFSAIEAVAGPVPSE